MSLGFFKFIYTIAIVGGFVTAIFGARLHEHAFFLWSCGAMLLLVLLGCTIDRSKASAVGARIQTGGYIFALTGFGGAIYGLRDLTQLGSITVPLAGALFTSVLGWWLGSEIVERCGSSEERSPAEVAGEAMQQIQSVLTEMQQTWGSFAAACTNAEAATQRLFTNHQHLGDKLAESARTLDGLAEATSGTFASLEQRLSSLTTAFEVHLSEDFLTSIQEVGRNTSELATNLKTASGHAADTAEYLQQSRLLIEELGQLLGTVTSLRHDQTAAAQEIAAGLRSVLDPLLIQLQELNRRTRLPAALDGAGSGRKSR